MIRYLVVRFKSADTLTDYDILSSHDNLSSAVAAFRRMTDGGGVAGFLRYAIVGPLPRDHS